MELKGKGIKSEKKHCIIFLLSYISYEIVCDHLRHFRFALIRWGFNDMIKIWKLSFKYRY